MMAALIARSARAGRPRPYSLSRMIRHLDQLLPLMGARLSIDERGRFIRGFGSQAIAVRAAEVHEPGSFSWFEAEAARLILEVVADDRVGDRRLASLESEVIEVGILDEAKASALAWSRHCRL